MPALTPSVIECFILPQNQQAPFSSAPVGRLSSLVNKYATKWQGAQSPSATDPAGASPTRLKVESRPGIQRLGGMVVRNPVTGAIISGLGVPDANLLTSLGNQAVAASAASPYVLAENGQSWQQYPYIYSPTVVKEKPVYTGNFQIANPDSACIGNIFLRTWSQFTAGGLANTLYAMFQDADGTAIREPFVIHADTRNQRIKCVADGTRFWVTYINDVTVVAKAFDTHGVELATLNFDTLDAAYAPWDLTFSGGYVLFARGDFTSGNLARVVTLTYASSTITATGANLTGTNCDYGVAWAENKTTTDAYLLTSSRHNDGDTHFEDEYGYKIGTLSATPSLTAYVGTAGTGHLYDSDGEGGTTGNLCEMTGIFRDGALRFQFSFFDATDIRLTRMVFGHTFPASTPTIEGTVRSVMSASRVFTLDFRDVVLVYYPQADPVSIEGNTYLGQPTYFLLDLLTHQVCGRFNAGNAGMEWVRQGYPIAGPDNATGAFTFCVGHVFTDSSSKIHASVGYQANQFVTTVNNNDIIRTFQRFVFMIGFGELVFGGVGQAFEAGGELFMPGAQATSFTGLNFSENNLNLAPAQPSLAEGTGGSLTVLGFYQYIAVFKWTDQNGNQVMSAPSPPVQKTLTGSNDKITLTGFPLHMTNKTDVSIALYRGSVTAGVPTTVLYRIDNPLTPLLNDVTQKTWTYEDSASDTSILSGEKLVYTLDPPVYPHDPCPSFSVGCVVEDRVMVVGPDNALWYSAAKQEGEAYWFSSPWRIPVPTNEEIKSITMMDTRVIICCEKSIWEWPIGGFPGPTGQGGNIQPVKQLPFTNGGTGHAALIRDGVSYSSSEGGIWIVTRGLLNYMMSDPMLDDIKGHEVTGIVVDQAQRMHIGLAPFDDDTHHTLVYDQQNGVWSHNTLQSAPQKLHVFRGRVSYAGIVTVMAEDTTTFKDCDDTGAQQFIPASFAFEPISFAGVKHFCRVWRYNIGGEVLANCTIMMDAVYNPESHGPIEESWTWDAVPGKLAEEFQPAFEQMENMTLAFSESFADGATGQSFVMEVIGFELAIENGLARVPLAARKQSSGWAPKAPRRGPFVPTDLPGLGLWLKADVGVFSDLDGGPDPVPGATGYVTQWVDQSGNFNDCFQSIADHRPALVGATINGLPAITFGGVHGFRWMSGLNTVLTPGSPRTVYLVLSPTPNGPYGVNAGGYVFGFLRNTIGAPIHLAALNYSAGPTGYYYDNGSGVGNPCTPRPAFGAPSVLKMIGDGSNVAITYGGVPVVMTSTTQRTETGDPGYSVGHFESFEGLGFTGDIAEIIVSGPLSIADQINMDKYLLRLYGAI